MATSPYTIDYNDPKFQQVESQKQAAITEVNDTYNNMINQSDQFYQDQIKAAQDYATQQQQIQQQQTDFTVGQINQQKDKANKDYIKEQSGAYVDWQKQSNQYGAGAEQMAAQGLTGTGFSESSQVSMYNTYQNRISTARESFNAAVLNYDNAIKDAQIQNNAKMAEIAYQALQTQLEMSLQGFQYKNELLTQQIAQKQQLEETYHNRWMDVLNQMNTENALAEQVRQYNESLALEREQMEEQVRQYNQSYSLQVKEFDESIRQFNEEIARLKKKDEQEYAMQIQQLELQKQQLELQKQQLAEEKRQFDKEYALAKSKASSSGGGGSSSSSSSGSSKITKSNNSKSSSTKSSGSSILDAVAAITSAANKALKKAAK